MDHLAHERDRGPAFDGGVRLHAADGGTEADVDVGGGPFVETLGSRRTRSAYMTSPDASVTRP